MASQFSKNLDLLRQSRGMTFEELANQSGLSKTYVWEIIKGKPDKNPSLETVIKIAKLFNVSIDQLVDHNVLEPCDKCNGKGFVSIN